MHSRTVAMGEPVTVDDPFALILDEAETVAVQGDDVDSLRELFGRRDPAPAASARAPPGSPWPGHNYGEAYASLRRAKPIRRSPRVLSESEVWDVDQLTHEPVPQPAAEVAPPVPWRRPAAASDPATAWLDTLGGDVTPAARSTEARLVDIAWRPPVETTIFETTDRLMARPRRMHPAARRRRRESPVIPPTVELAAIAVLLLFALAVLQLLLS